MYHIPKDKRAENSALQLLNGLTTALQHQTIENTTVKNIVDKSNVSRSTFYRLFDNANDILYWGCEQILLHSLKQARNSSSQKKAVFYFIQNWDNNRFLLSAITKNNKTNILFDIHIKYRDEIKNLIFTDKTISDIEKDYVVGILAAIIPMVFQLEVKYPTTGFEESYSRLISGSETLVKFFKELAI